MSEKTRLVNIRVEKPLHPRRCETCDHFEAPTPPEEVGQCVACYPVALPLGAGPLGQIAAGSLFPPMKSHQRCAKWEVKRPPEN